MASSATPVTSGPAAAAAASVSGVAASSGVVGFDVKKMARKDREFLGEFDAQVKDIRTQLNEQLRCLDYRVETQVSVVAELQDFFRRRAEVELDYSKNLDKLARSLMARHKEQKQKREQWHLFSSYACWQHLVAQTKRQARDHALLGEIYSTTVIERLSQVTVEVQRIYRRCREVGYESHEELLKVLHELHAAMKTWQTYQIEYRQAETKLRYVEAQRAKLESSIARDKLEKSKKFKLIEKEIVKRRNKFNDAHLKALKARNEYVLCMDAANAAIHKYFIDDLSDIIDCMDIGFHSCVARALMMHISAEENVRRSLQVSVDGMNKCLSNLDSRADKQRFLEANHAAFMIPKKFDSANYQHKIDEGAHELSAVSQLREDLESRFVQLHKRLTSLRAESEEVWKTLETAESTLMDMISAKDYDVTSLFTAAAAAAAAADDDKSVAFLTASVTAAAGKQQPEAAVLKLRADRQETEDFYLTKFREYVLGSNLMHRLQAKHDLIQKALHEGGQLPTSPKVAASSAASAVGAAGAPGAVGGGLQQQHSNNKPRRRRIGRTPLIGQPKLFGGSLEEYLEVTNEEIPLIMKSCIRVINLYGLHHQGIFRVSGSQVEINNFREAFERGEDPLADVTDASDINSVAGVFKLFLRELREPLFPIVFFDQFMEIAQLDLKEDFKIRMREVVQTLPRAVFIVMRYLFSFLNHLSEYSDENMMDPYNLAICFGPTLVPVPEDKDQVQYQNLVNELIKNIIINAEDIFPNDGGTVYERYITREPDEGEVGEAPSDTMSEDVDSEVYPSEDDSVFREKDISIQIFGKSETLEAVAQFDFSARSQRELSFKKGDLLTLYTQVSGDWWKGSKDGRDGLVPDKYIMLRIRDEDRERLELAKAPSAGSTTSSGSEADSIRRRTSSSSDASGPVSMATRTPKAVHSSQRIQAPTQTPSISSTSTSASSVSEPSLDSATSLPSPSTDKRIGSRSSDHHRPGVSVALVRPTSLSSTSPAPGSGGGATTNGLAKESEPLKTSPVSGILSIPILEQSVSKEKLETASAINDVLVSGEATPAPAAVATAAAVTTSTEDVATLDDDDGTASLALSDEKSLSDSFNSLIDVDLDEQQQQQQQPQLQQQQQQQQHAIGELAVTSAAANQGRSGDQSQTNESATSFFKRQNWETRSLERHHPQAINITVGEWCDSKPLDGAGSGQSASGVNKGSFVRKRDLWEKRSSINSSPACSSATATAASPISARQKHTPDLVMDLPPSLPLSSSPKEEKTSSGGGAASTNGGDSGEEAESPSSPDMTAAETFAMQNQSTLKKSKVVKKEPEAAAESAVKLQMATFSCAPPGGSASGNSPAASVALKTSTTPKLATRFPHLYGTPMPVLPNAFAASGDSPASQLIKLKPTVMKKPSLPTAVGASPETNRRSSSSSSSSYHSDSSNV